MSLAAIDTRVQEIRTLIATINGRPAQPAAASGTSFASTLASAQSAASQTAPTGAAPATGAGGSTAFDAQIQAAASANGIDPALLKGLVAQESGFNPNARSGAGAVGLTQLMPGTAAALGVTNPLDPAQSLDGGAKYLRQQLDRFGGDTRLALAAYNAGPGAVQKYGGVPPYSETQNYVDSVMAKAAAYGGAIA